MLGLRDMSAEAPEKSQRRFARENNLSETALRNYLLYARAAGVRYANAPETADDTIRDLSVAKLRLYLQLPDDRRDEWLDRGASTDEANEILAKAATQRKGSTGSAKTRASAPAARSRTPEEPAVADGGEEDEGPTCAKAGGGEDGVQANGPAAGDAEDTPSEPLTPAEQEVVSNVLGSYRDGRPLVRQKILGGLGAYPDAVAFFRRMIKSGS
jgi:hypothetical protein